MKFIALVDTPHLESLRRAAAGLGEVTAVANARGILTAVMRSGDSCVVLDPAYLSAPQARRLAAVLASSATTVIAYASINLAAAAASVILAQTIGVRFVFQGTPDEDSSLRRALLLAPRAELGPAVVSALEETIAALPTQLCNTISIMLRSGNAPASPTALARKAGISRRAMDRWLYGSGIGSARLLIAASRVIAAYQPLTKSTLPIARIAAAVGYASQRTLDNQCVRLTGMTAAELRSSSPPIAAVAEAMCAAITHRPRHDIARGKRPSAGARTR